MKHTCLNFPLRMRGIAASLLLLAAVGFVACDDEDYDSRPPRFSDMTAQMLSDESAELRSGEPIVLTAVQSKKGHLLLGTTYTWTSSPEEGVSHRPMAGDIYDLNPANPTDTVTFATPGTYRVTMKAVYKTSGQKGMKSGGTEELPDGGRVTYSVDGGALFRYNVTVEKYFKIK
ncbi:MAG: hypothetical protein IJ692_00895 [Alloprevotella sp.]|nr:hypothetical protein [Alloprevotella sp.]MBR1651929.1 hypothetical protein [Alloprevotella sp.]